MAGTMRLVARGMASDSPTERPNKINFSVLQSPAEIFELVEFVGDDT